MFPALQRTKATIMKLLGLAYLAVLLGVNSATAQSPTGFGHNNVGDIQINYYSDSNCSDYSLQVNVTWAPLLDPAADRPLNWTQLQQGCYNYAYGSSSVNIANCAASHCECRIAGGRIRICMTAMLQPSWTTIVSLTRLPTSPSCAHTNYHTFMIDTSRDTQYITNHHIEYDNVCLLIKFMAELLVY